MYLTRGILPEQREGHGNPHERATGQGRECAHGGHASIRPGRDWLERCDEDGRGLGKDAKLRGQRVPETTRKVTAYTYISERMFPMTVELTLALRTAERGSTTPPGAG